MGGAYQPPSVVWLTCQRGWLTTEAAASITRLDAILGHCMQITEAGRSWAQQNVHYQKYLRDGYPIALNPDTPSVHQKGNAIDSDEAQNFVARMEDHGWYRTVYRWVNGKWTLVERWHFEYFYARDNHRYETPSGGNVVPVPAEPEIEEEPVTNVTVAVRKGGSTIVRTFDLATGEENIYESSNDATGDAYNRNVALTYGGSPLVPISYISQSHFDKIGSENAERRARLAAK